MSLRTRLPLGTALTAVLALFLPVSGWAAEKVLHSFVPSPSGASPTGKLIRDAAGNLYGTAGGGVYGEGVVFKLRPKLGGGWTESVLHSFSGGADGAAPAAGLIMDTAGNLYGTAGGGSTKAHPAHGVVFELTPSSNGTWNEKVLHRFIRTTDGADPNTELIFDASGNLYGTTASGVTVGGTVFELTPSSGGMWTETVLYNFCSQDNCDDGHGPSSRLIFDQAGNLYGTTSSGGTQYYGVVFKLSPSSSGWTETVLHNFPMGQDDGYEPQSDLIFDQAGNLYGTTPYGGAQSGGIVFKLTPGSGGQWTEAVLHSFKSGGHEPSEPAGGLVFDASGNLYGTTESGGSGKFCLPDGCGIVFQLTPRSGGKWAESVVHQFAASTDGAWPVASLIIDQSGNLYGTTGLSAYSHGDYLYPAGSVFELTPASSGWIETIHQFRPVDGGAPQANIVSDAAGNLYGTTAGYGTSENGSVFELSSGSKGTWTRTLLYNFKGGKDGSFPYAGLVFDEVGNLYGTTEKGGSGSGTVFELSPVGGGKWAEKIIYAFQGYPTDGGSPVAGLVFDPAGNLYGTTQLGGSLGYCGYGCGTVFKLTASSGGGWTETMIYQFNDISNGAIFPTAGLALDSAGNLYGTASQGGLGFGVVFELSPSPGGTWNESVLYTFTGGADGGSPVAGVIFDSVGNLYGTTESGDYYRCPNGCGVVFELSPGSGNNWTESVLHSFSGKDGDYPTAGLIFDRAGNLYGTTAYGGTVASSCPYGCGLAFKLTPNHEGGWTESVLNSFTGERDGANPLAGLLLDAAGNLYGTASGGGRANAGVVFEVTP
jgi:uncharacterized repeat protein (TIGR03803 family)